jgi:hypothetical protein
MVYIYIANVYWIIDFDILSQKPGKGKFGMLTAKR